jgi:hypothetical protein
MTVRSPITLVSSTCIERPATEVAAFVLDWGNDPSWRSQVRTFTVDPPGQATPGQVLVEELSFAGMLFRTPTVIDAAGPLEAAYSGGSASVDVAGWRRVTPLDDDKSRVDLHTEITLRGALGALSVVLGRSYRRTDAADVARLAELLTSVRSR